MLVLKSKIRIGNLLFDNLVHTCVIDSDRNKFTETAVVKLPNRLRTKNRKITDYIKINDPVTIELGYAPELDLIFTGYVSRIDPDSPATVTCENEAFVWKQKSVGPFTGRNLKISDLLQGAGYTGALSLGVDPEIGDWVVGKNSTVLNLLEELRNKFGLLSYWRKDKTLYIAEDFGFGGSDSKFSFQSNIISSDLDFVVNAGDIQPVSHGVSVQKDNKKIELFAYYLDGETVVSKTRPAGILNTMSVPYVSESALSDLIKRRLPRLRNDGIKGSFTAFGAPRVEHGGNAVLIDNKFAERNGTWKIQRVETSFGVGGFRQVIEPDQKITT
jgi:hypothetical protein